VSEVAPAAQPEGSEVVPAAQPEGSEIAAAGESAPAGEPEQAAPSDAAPVTEAAQKADEDKVTPDEMANAPTAAPTEEQSAKLFDKVDSDHNEVITREEFKQAQETGLIPSDEATSTALVPVGAASGTIAPYGGPMPSGQMTAEELQMTLANGLREAINESVKGAVGEVVNDAFTQLKVEMEKRDAQAEVLAEQMNELTKSVTDLQEQVQTASPLGASAPPDLFTRIGPNKEGVITRSEFERAQKQGLLPIDQ